MGHRGLSAVCSRSCRDRCADRGGGEGDDYRCMFFVLKCVRVCLCVLVSVCDCACLCVLVIDWIKSITAVFLKASHVCLRHMLLSAHPLQFV